ncbi:MAG: sugar ABC transporter permease [Chloroflexota bacterium]|nr:sugar ABC transporter permease [Chloroflexota bacterium]
MLVAPSVLIVALVAFYPLYETFRLSLTNARLGSTNTVGYLGLQNYRTILSDSDFIDALRRTVFFTISSVGIELVAGMIIALVINSNFRGRTAMRTSMLVPWAIPTVVSALMWQWMFHDIFGIINDVLVNKLHIIDEKIAWLAGSNTAFAAMVAVDVWKTTPFMALLLLAGLQIIPTDVYEASTVDGASRAQQFWQITLPLVRPALLVALIFRTMDAFRIFDLPYVLTGASPQTQTVAVYARDVLVGFQRLGRGSAAAVIIFLLIAFMVFLYTRLLNFEEE